MYFPVKFEEMWRWWRSFRGFPQIFLSKNVNAPALGLEAQIAGTDIIQQLLLPHFFVVVCERGNSRTCLSAPPPPRPLKKHSNSRAPTPRSGDAGKKAHDVLS